MIRKFIVVLIVFFLIFVSSGEAKASSVDVQWFPLSPGFMPTVIVPADSGGVWFGSKNMPEIGYMDEQGDVSYYQVGDVVNDLARDTSGDLWFGLAGGGLGYLDPSTNVIISNYVGHVYNLTYNAGRVWFLTGPHGYGSTTTNGDVVLYQFPQGFSANRMAAGPNGNLWVTDKDHNTIEQVRPSNGFVTTYILPQGSRPGAITSGPDGAHWFIEAGAIGRITENGNITHFRENITSTCAGNITGGPNNTLWFTAGGSLNSITTNGRLTRVFGLIGTPGCGQGYVTATAEGFKWVTDVLGNQIGRVS